MYLCKKNSAMKKLIETPVMSVEEYIAFEEKSEVRHEFINGQLYEMPGTTDYHNHICGNIYIMLRQIFKGTLARVFQENVKARILHDKDYTYPDVFVTDDERDEASRHIKRHPSVIIEVLSDKTRVYDKTDKFIRYQKIESLKHYLKVEPEKTLVECYTKQADGSWEVETFTHVSDVIPITALNIQLPLSEIYE
jgi:Uma2 family endonuclease